MAYTTIKKPSDYFNTKLYTGNSDSGDNVVAVGFQPDFTWFKSRTQGYNNYLIDAIRGDEKYISSDNTNAEASWGANDVTWTPTGFTLNTTGGSGINEGGQGANNMVAWNWLANGAGSANTAGSINSTVSANTTSGFSIVKWTGTGSNATIGHGLGVAPRMIIMKNTSQTASWGVYHESMGNDKRMFLNTTDAESAGVWQNTSPTSTVFSVDGGTITGGSGHVEIAYCFADVQGFSKFGSYVGNGNADGTFVYTGFKPAFVMVKNVNSGAQGWLMFDDERSPFNVANKFMVANLSQAEASTSTHTMDFLSNGFKIRGTDGGVNGSGNTIIYMAFAEQPLVGDNPATAR
tara:strand:- start:104 stop:1147 length:1044 start_codon:yes stop_codon:yes gene_type:complete